MATTERRSALTFGNLWGLLRDAAREWNEDKVPRLGAALAYYTVFSLAPLLVIVIAIAGLAFGEQAVEGQIVGQLQTLVGAQGAQLIQTMIANAREAAAGATVISLGTLLLGAIGAFGQLQDALNTIWEVQPPPNAGPLAVLKQRLFSLTMVLGVGFLLLVSLVISTALTALNDWLGAWLPGGALLWQIVNIIISLAFITLLFALLFKIVPDAEIAWADVWIGAALTAVLFTLGRFLIGLYLGTSAVGSTYGAAGSLIVVLVWVYYSAQILLYGAEFTQVYANRYGSRVQPEPPAVALTAEAKAEQGLQPQPVTDFPTLAQKSPRRYAPAVVSFIAGIGAALWWSRRGRNGTKMEQMR